MDDLAWRNHIDPSCLNVSQGFDTLGLHNFCQFPYLYLLLKIMIEKCVHTFKTMLQSSLLWEDEKE
jgi:hypothetical protein